MATKIKKRIAVFANCGIGNFLMYTPFMQAVRKWWKCDLDILTASSSARYGAIEDICRHSNFIDGIVPIPSESFDASVYHRIFWSHHNDHVDEELKGFAVQVSKADNCITMPVWKWRDTKVHEVEYYMNFLYDLGYVGPIPTMRMPKASKPKIVKGKGLTVAFCNGAYEQAVWDKKKWEVSRWIELKKTLKNWTDCQIVCVGGKNLEKDHKEINPDIDYTGKLSITETAYVLSQCDLMITTDTGPMHISAALNKPLIALFGSTHQTKNRPWMRTPARAKVIQHREIPCCPCQDTDDFHTCKDYKCMRAITPAEIMHEVRGMAKYGIIRVRSV